MTDEIQQEKAGAEDRRGKDTTKEPETAGEELQERIAQLEEDITSRDGELSTLKETLAAAVAKYRGAILATDPGVPEELLKGETVEEIDASLEQAQRIVSKVRQELENDVTAKSVPAGAPIRTGPDLSGLSGQAKIQIALKQDA